MMGSQLAVEQQSIKTIDNTDAGCDGKRAFCMAGRRWHEDSSGATDSVASRHVGPGVVAAAAELAEDICNHGEHTRKRDGCYEGWLDPPLSRHFIIVLIYLSRVAESGQRHTVVNQSWPHEHTDDFWVFGVVIRSFLSPLLSSSAAHKQDVGRGRKESNRKKSKKSMRG